MRLPMSVETSTVSAIGSTRATSSPARSGARCGKRRSSSASPPPKATSHSSSPGRPALGQRFQRVVVRIHPAPFAEAGDQRKAAGAKAPGHRLSGQGQGRRPQRWPGGGHRARSPATVRGCAGLRQAAATPAAGRCRRPAPARQRPAAPRRCAGGRRPTGRPPGRRTAQGKSRRPRPSPAAARASEARSEAPASRAAAALRG